MAIIILQFTFTAVFADAVITCGFCQHTLILAGALNLTREAQRRSQEAQNRVLQSTASLAESEKIRKRVEDQLAAEEVSLQSGQNGNENLLKDLDAKVIELNANIPGLNTMVKMA